MPVKNATVRQTAVLQEGYSGAREEGWTQAGLPVETVATPGASYQALRNKSGGSG